MLQSVNKSRQCFFTIENKHFEITGLVHMDLNYEKIYTFVLAKDGYIANHIIIIGCQAETFLAVNNVVPIAP
jgi:hypothetical protein